MRKARRAGIIAAARVMQMMKAAVRRKTKGSDGLTATSTDETRRAKAAATSAPVTRPASANLMP